MVEPPDAEPAELTDAQLRELGEDLRDLEEELNEALALAEEGSKPVKLDQQAVGRLSRMDAMQQQAMASSNKRNTATRLALARSAIALFDDGDYGFCRSCEEPIGYARLKARPETPLCLLCQGGREASR